MSRFTAGLFALALMAVPARAEIREDPIMLPVSIGSGFGGVEQQLAVTIIRDSDRKKSPFLILNHGRATTADQRHSFRPASYRAQARYFVQRGFAVFIPTRIGYGETGGPDLENSGPTCNNRNYRAALRPAAAEVAAVVAYARAQNYIDAKRGVIAGQSMGGFTTMASAAANLPGVQLAINFAGGGGGDPVKRPGQPCRPDFIEDAFASFGASTKVPTLWLYSANDKYWGPDLPKSWFAAFKASGGRGDFIALPPSRENGHGSFTQNMPAWKPGVDAFLARHRF